jgi:hypothetical protein
MKMTNQYEAFKAIRKTWGEMSPVTRVVKSKKPYSRKDKFKKDFNYEFN